MIDWNATLPAVAALLGVALARWFDLQQGKLEARRQRREAAVEALQDLIRAGGHLWVAVNRGLSHGSRDSTSWLADMRERTIELEVQAMGLVVREPRLARDADAYVEAGRAMFRAVLEDQDVEACMQRWSSARTALIQLARNRLNLEA